MTSLSNVFLFTAYTILKNYWDTRWGRLEKRERERREEQTATHPWAPPMGRVFYRIITNPRKVARFLIF